jgi:MoaA/NifB/PqqE/SkfB family radical SAM enzyme
LRLGSLKHKDTKGTEKNPSRPEKSGDSGYIDVFNREIRDVFRDALKASFRHPARALFFARTAVAQRRAARRRLAWEQQGIHVPPLLIASITGKCNLKCKGCYAQSQRWAGVTELPLSRWQEIVREADDLGISLIMLAGGEPLTRPEILDVTRQFPKIIFPLFTNGLLFDARLVAEFRRQRHVIPVVSLEGFELETDERRGLGVYDRVQQVIGKLEGGDLFFGVSLTVTRRNFPVLTSERFFRTFHDAGCRLFIYVEYTPVEEGTEELVLTHEQKLELETLTQGLRRKYSSVTISFPGDEEPYGGCLAAGRGFIHVGPDGSLEPCPFAPYSDTSLQQLSLKEALQSELLRKIRENHDRLSETRGGCALWENREWVRSLIAKSPASR